MAKIIDNTYDNEIIMTNNRAKNWYIVSKKAKKTKLRTLYLLCNIQGIKNGANQKITSFTLASMALLQKWFILKYVVVQLQVLSIQQSLVNRFIEL